MCIYMYIMIFSYISVMFDNYQYFLNIFLHMVPHSQELLIKEALDIQTTPSEERFNPDEGLEVPGCWNAVIRRQRGRRNPHRSFTSNDVYPQ